MDIVNISHSSSILEIHYEEGKRMPRRFFFFSILWHFKNIGDFQKKKCDENVRYFRKDFTKFCIKAGGSKYSGGRISITQVNKMLLLRRKKNFGSRSKDFSFPGNLVFFSFLSCKNNACQLFHQSLYDFPFYFSFFFCQLLVKFAGSCVPG